MFEILERFIDLIKMVQDFIFSLKFYDINVGILICSMVNMCSGIDIILYYVGLKKEE